MRDTEREAETQAEGEAGSMQGARRGTRSQVSRIRPWAEGGAKLLGHWGCPNLIFSIDEKKLTCWQLRREWKWGDGEQGRGEEFCFSVSVVLLFYLFIYFYFFKDLIYLFMRDTEREAETEAEGEAGSMQGARCRTPSWVPRIRPWAKGGAKLLSHPGYPS